MDENGNADRKGLTSPLLLEAMVTTGAVTNTITLQKKPPAKNCGSILHN